MESLVALINWIVLGFLFYKRKEYNKIPETELSYLILGNHGKGMTGKE